MDFSEKNIEDVIFDAILNNKSSALIERGLDSIKSYSVFCRQIDLKSYGRLDMVGFGYDHYGLNSEKTLKVGVFEFKKGEVNINALLQAVRYCKGIEQYAKKFNIDISFKINLIGSAVCMGDFCYIPDILQNVNIYTIHISLEHGVIFRKEKDWAINKPEFIRHTDVEKAVKAMLFNTIRSYVDNPLPF